MPLLRSRQVPAADLALLPGAGVAMDMPLYPCPSFYAYYFESLCQPFTSQLTNNGLHLMMTSIFKATRSMLAQPLGGSSGLNSTEFRFIWALAQSDVEGGMVSCSA